MKHYAYIYDEEQIYVKKLVSFMNISGSFSFVARACGSKEEFIQLCTENVPEIVIVSEEAIELVINVECEKFILSKSHRDGDSRLHYISKYQSCDRIIKDINEILSHSDRIGSIIIRKTKLTVISCFTPVKRSLTTTMAIGMGQILSRKSKTLYLNLESFSGLETLLNRKFSKDIGDLFYHMHSKSTGFQAAMASITENVDGLDIIPPFNNQADLISIKSEEWSELIHYIEQETEYSYLIIDLSDGVQGLMDIMHISDAVITPMDNDEVAISKLTQYEDSLRKAGYEDVLEKTKKCNVLHKHREEGLLGNLGTGEFGEYVRTVIQGVLVDV